MAISDNNPWEKNDQSQPTTNFVSEPVKKNVLDIQPRRILSVWPFVILGGLLCFSISWTFLRYVINIYEVTTSVVLENTEEMGALEAIYSTKDPLNDQVALLKSPAVANKIVDELYLNYHAFADGKFKDQELFSKIKWSVITPGVENRKLLSFELATNAMGFRWKMGNLAGKGNWGKECKIGSDVVLIQKISGISNNTRIYFYETNKEVESNNLSRAFVVNSKRESNVVSISLKDAVPERAAAILSTLIPAYIEAARISKSLSLQQSLNFIDERLRPLTIELDSVEANITELKGEMGLLEDVSKTKNAESQILKYEEQFEKFKIQKQQLDEIEKSLDNLNENESFISFASVEPAIQLKIDKYYKLQLERKRLSKLLTDNNPRILEADNSLMEVQKAIQRDFMKFRRNLKSNENILREKLASAKGSIKQFPDYEKRIEKEKRKLLVKQDLQNMLLKSKEDVSIKLAGVSVKTSVLSAPQISSKPISPKRDEIMIGATLAGLLLPLIFALLREFLNNKIVSKSQLEQITNIPVLSEIDLAKQESDAIIISEIDRSLIGEQFRGLRTNLGFYKKIDKTLYVLVTSSMSGEGKSFISANLAASFALLGKKVALMEFDLRKPKLRQRFGIPSRKGIVNVLMGELEPSAIAEPVMEGYHFDLMPSGPIPPNPSELIGMPRMEKLKKYLDENYDVVIIDTPPFGLVTDAQLLNNWTDISLVVVRYMNTLREQVAEIDEARQKKTFKNMALIFNGIKTHGYYGYRYGYYGQKRKYGYGYYAKNG